MSLRRRLMFAVLTASSVLGIYIVCVNLETSLFWSIVPLRATTQAASSRSQVSEEPLDGKSSSQQWATQPPAKVQHQHSPIMQVLKKSTATVPRPAEDNVPHASVALDKPRSRAPPTLKPQRPTQAARSIEPPFIGDSYMSEEAAAPRACTNSIRNQVTKTEFGGKYLKDIPILQWAHHITRENYQRLSQYPGAHGWGSVDYKTLSETLSVLNSSANWRMLDDWKQRRNGSECIRCAVVGNGGILKGSNKGKEIDGHHYVFRTNGAVIQGFEQDVGTRTTHYTFSTNTLMNSMWSYAGVGYRGPPVSKETRYVFLPDHDRDYLLIKAAATHIPVERGPDRDKDPSKYFGADVSVEKLKMYHPDFLRYLRNRFLRSSTLKTKYKDIYRTSTGAAMLLAALHTCDQVSAYGFMTPDYNNYSDHYFDRSYHPVGFYVNHDLRMEMNLWQQLHQAGLLRLYQRQGEKVIMSRRLEITETR